MLAAALAALLAVLDRLLHWQGVDVAASVFRVDSYRRSGFSLWDFQWYGGHWTVDYSFLYPPLAGAFGVTVLTTASAASAALAFDRLARRHLAPTGMIASYVFAAGTVVQVAIGQLPFLTGEAFGLLGLWALVSRRAYLATPLALAATLTSPLAGAFVGLTVAAWILAARGTTEAGGAAARVRGATPVILAALAPVVASAALFPGDGPMPYPVIDWAWEMIVAAAVALLAGRELRTLRVGCACWMAVASFAEIFPSPLGGNIGRIEDIAALPVAAALVWRRAALLMPMAAVPLALSQWGPAWSAVTAAPQPSTRPSFYAPLDRILVEAARSGPAGRVEVVPTKYHWEAAYVAPTMPLARGWERQLDVADNPEFYRSGGLTPQFYREWLIDNGVRFVALPLAPLDDAGVAEAQMVSSGAVAGLKLVWRSPQWKLYQVSGSTGIVPAPARLVSSDHGRVVVDAPSPGTVLVRVRFSPDWVLTSGTGCLTRANGSWILVSVPWPEQFSLDLSIAGGGEDACPRTAVAAESQ